MEHGRPREGKSLRVLIAAARGHVPPKCLSAGCPEDQRLRLRFGCDGPTAQYVVEAPSGHVEVSRCPRWHADRIGERGVRLLVAWRRVKALRALPVAGGMMDQANVFLEALDVLTDAERRADARDRKRAEA